MIAQDAHYHRNCLTSLYKKTSTAKLEGHYTDKERQLHGIVFSEIISYIEEVYNSAETAAGNRNWSAGPLVRWSAALTRTLRHGCDVTGQSIR